MRIAMIGQKGVPAVWGGVERHVEHLAVELAKREHEVIVFARKYYVTKELAQEYMHAHSGIEVRFLPTLHTKHLDAIIHTFFSTVVAMWRNVDIYHYHSVGPSLLAWIPRLLRPHATVITTFHSPDREHQKWGFFARFVLTVGEWAAVTFPHFCITVSKELQAYALKRYGARTYYVPNAVDVPVYADASMIRAQYGLAPRSYMVLISRLIPHKGVHNAIVAFKQCTEVDKKLVIVGDESFTKEYVQQLHDQAKDDPRILFVGFQHGRVLHELWTNAAAFIHPSYSEGLSIALLEAASYSLPIICSSIQANIEVVGTHALTYAPDDVNTLVKHIQDVCAHPDEAFERAKLLRRKVTATYSWDIVSQAVEHLYQQRPILSEEGDSNETQAHTI